MSKKNILFKNTGSKPGRNWIITPDNSELDSLAYSRIILNKQISKIDYSNGKNEVALICLAGNGTVRLGDFEYGLKAYDSLFVPADKSGTIETGTNFDLVECSAPSDATGDPVFIPFDTLKEDEHLTEDLGFDSCRRKIHRLIDDNVPAKRLLCGLIFSDEGNWTSWAPHEHTDTKEEIYLYFDMPPPAFGIQLVYEDLDKPDYFGPVYNDDAVVIKRGYHPNVAIPGHQINFIWIMATLDPSMERTWAGVNTQPEFQTD